MSDNNPVTDPSTAGPDSRTLKRVGIGAGISLAQASMYNVDGGHRVVMFDRLFGVSRKVRGEGTHFRIPWVQEPHDFDVRIKPRNISSNTGTKDLQRVEINLRVLSRPLNLGACRDASSVFFPGRLPK